MKYGFNKKSDLCKAAEDGIKREERADNLKVAAVVICIIFLFLLVAAIEQVLA